MLEVDETVGLPATPLRRDLKCFNNNRKNPTVQLRLETIKILHNARSRREADYRAWHFRSTYQY